MDVHLALKSERERQNVTAAQMAEYLGISEDMVRRYDSGRSDISLRQASRYAERLGRQLGDILPASQIRSAELQPLIMALQDFEPEEREWIVKKLAYDLTFMAARMNDRAARHDDRNAQNILPFRPTLIEERKEMSDVDMERLAEVMKLAGAAPRKAARGPEREVRFFGHASAGEGIEFFDDIPEEYRQIPQWAWNKGARGVFKAAGESMIDVGIFPDDIMFVKPTPEPSNGSIVICTLNKKVFVKKLKRDERGIPSRLESKNPKYTAAIPISINDEIEFFGEVVGRTGDL